MVASSGPLGGLPEAFGEPLVASWAPLGRHLTKPLFFMSRNGPPEPISSSFFGRILRPLGALLRKHRKIRVEKDRLKQFSRVFSRKMGSGGRVRPGLARERKARSILLRYLCGILLGWARVSETGHQWTTITVATVVVIVVLVSSSSSLLLSPSFYSSS